MVQDKNLGHACAIMRSPTTSTPSCRQHRVWRRASVGCMLSEAVRCARCASGRVEQLLLPVHAAAPRRSTEGHAHAASEQQGERVFVPTYEDTYGIGANRLGTRHQHPAQMPAVNTVLCLLASALRRRRIACKWPCLGLCQSYPGRVLLSLAVVAWLSIRSDASDVASPSLRLHPTRYDDCV